MSLIDYKTQADYIRKKEKGSYICGYIALEFCPYGNLGSLLKANSPLDDRTVKGIFIQILRGIKALHDANIAHRDIKMENILIG